MRTCFMVKGARISLLSIICIMLALTGAYAQGKAKPAPAEPSAAPAPVVEKAVPAPKGEAAVVAAEKALPEAPEAAPAAPEVKAQPKVQVQAQPSAADIEKRRKMIREAKDKLNNLSWKIAVTQMAAGANKETYDDVLKFTDNKIESDKLVAEGFSQTNYTVSVGPNDMIVWETMQTSEKGGLAFWKGEVEGDIMRGVLSRHINETNIKDYSFVSAGKEKAEAAPKPQAAPLPEGTVAAKPIEAGQPVVPAKPAVPAQPAVPAAAVKPATPAQPAVPAKPAVPATAAKSAAAAKPAPAVAQAAAAKTAVTAATETATQTTVAPVKKAKKKGFLF